MIYIINDYYIDADENSFSVVKRTVRTKGNRVGEEYYKSISFHNTLKACMLRLNELLARDGIMYDWKEKTLTNVYKRLTEAISELGGNFSKPFNLCDK